MSAPRTTFRMALSRAVGVAADVPLPKFLRGPLYRAFAAAYGADLGECAEPPQAHRSFAEFFVRRLADGVRPIAADPRALVSPVDGTVQICGAIETGALLQAKGRSYSPGALVGDESAGRRLEGGWQWTIYLGPRDYHRVHAPLDARLAEVRWLPGTRYSVAPQVLARRLVLPLNERVALRLESACGPLWLVLVGALNVGRIRVVDVARGAAPGPDARFARGAELARFELGSTVVLLAPPGVAGPQAALHGGERLRLGEPIGICGTAGERR